MVSEKAMAELRGLALAWRHEDGYYPESKQDCADDLDAALDKLSKENG